MDQSVSVAVTSDDLVKIIDTRRISSHCTGKLNRLIDALSQRRALGVSYGPSWNNATM